MPNGLPIIQGRDPLGGLRMALGNLVTSGFQGLQNRQLAQQLGQLFPQQNLQGITDPRALQAALNLGLQQQQQQAALALQTAKPTTPESESQFTAFLGRKISAGTATEEEQTLFEQLTKVPSTQIFTGAITPPTRTKLEKDIIDLQATLGELAAIEPQFDENFFTYKGRAKSFFTGLAEKAEIPVPQAATEFLKRRTKFFADSKRVFLKFRKFITGVAGGIEEFREIAKATIDPESDSPTQFKAKFESMRDNAIRVSNLMMAIRNSGLDEQDKSTVEAALSIVPLQNVPLNVRPDITLESLSGRTQPTTSPIGQPAIKPLRKPGFLGRKESEFPAGFRTPPLKGVADTPRTIEEFNRLFITPKTNYEKPAYRRLRSIWLDLPPEIQDKIRAALHVIGYTAVIGADDLKPYLEKK